jgi:hypothetical protein
LDASTSPPKERYAVPKDNVIKLIQPGVFDDQLTEVLGNGARALLARAVEAEVADFLAGRRVMIEGAVGSFEILSLRWMIRLQDDTIS